MVKTPGSEIKTKVEGFLKKLDEISQKMVKKDIKALREMLIYLVYNPFLDDLGIYSLKEQIGEEKTVTIHITRNLLKDLWFNFADGNNGYPKSSHHLVEEIGEYLGIFIQGSVFKQFKERRGHSFLDYIHADGAFLTLWAETEEFWENSLKNEKTYNLESVE